MLSLIIENLSNRFRNIQDPFDVLTGYWNAIDVGICRDHDIYHEVFFTDETNVPTCDSQIEEKTRRAINKLSDKDLAKIG